MIHIAGVSALHHGC